MVLSVGQQKRMVNGLLMALKGGALRATNWVALRAPRDGEWLNDGTVVGTIEGYEDGE